MGLDRRQLDDILVEKVAGNLDAVGIDLVQHEHGRLGLVMDPFDLGLVQVHVSQIVLVHNQFVLVVELSLVGIHHYGPVVSGDQVLVAILPQRADNAFQLPGRGRTGRVPLLPGDIDLEQSLFVLGKRLLIIGQREQFAIVIQHGFRASPKQGDPPLARKILVDHGNPPTFHDSRPVRRDQAKLNPV